MGVLLLALGIDGVVAQSSLVVAGTVAVSDCTPEYDDGALVGYTCSGRFVADDGSFEIPRIEVNPVFEYVPDGLVSVAVTNAHASIAHQHDKAWLLQICSGLFMLVLGFWSPTAAA